MSFWKNRSDQELWNGSSYRPQSFDSSMDDSPRWQSDRMDLGNRNGPPSLLSGRHFSSSNQINSSLFNDYSPRRNTESSYRGGGYSGPVGGRVIRNSLVDFSRARRILQKRALNAVSRGSPAAPVKRKRPAKQTPAKKEVKKDTSLNDTSNDDKKKNTKVAPEFRLAILWVNDNKQIISTEQGTLILQKLEQLLDEVPIVEGESLPQFFASGASVGVVRIVCANEKSVEWVKGAVEKLTDLWEGAKFEVVQQKVLNALVHISLFLSYNDIEVIVLLNRIERQNPGLNTEKWRVHKEVIEDKKRTLVFLIDQASVEYLEKNEWRVYIGLKRIKITQGVNLVKPGNKPEKQ